MRIPMRPWPRAFSALLCAIQVCSTPSAWLNAQDKTPEPAIEIAVTAPDSQLDFLWFVNKIHACDLSELGRSLDFFMSQTCQLLIEAEHFDEALALWQRTLETQKAHEQEPTPSYDLLDVALQLSRFDLADEVIRRGGTQRNAMLDKLAIAKYKNGDAGALKDYPHGAEVMTFYDAMDLGSAFIEMGELNRLEDLLKDLEITKENDPEDVAGLLYDSLAEKARARGDLETAKHYVNKAFQVAGRQFYTGYHIQVLHKSLHGTLVDDLDSMIQQGLAYRGHMARELLWSLARELVRLGEFESAKQIAEKHLQKDGDLANMVQIIAQQQTENGDYRRALGLIRQVKNPLGQDLARVEVAKSLLAKGNPDAAIELVDFALQRKVEHENPQRFYESIAEFEGMLGQPDRIQAALDATDVPREKALRLVQAMRGFLKVHSP